MTAITNRQPAITIEYDTAKGRTSKAFDGEQIAAAKKLYMAKLNAGKNPTITGDDAGQLTAADATDTETAELNAAVAEAQATQDVGPAKIKLGIDPKAKPRAYYAGRLLASQGLDAGIPDGMARAVSKAFNPRKLNDRESAFSLRYSWHAIKGFLDAQAEAEATEAKG